MHGAQGHGGHRHEPDLTGGESAASPALLAPLAFKPHRQLHSCASPAAVQRRWRWWRRPRRGTRWRGTRRRVWRRSAPLGRIPSPCWRYAVVPPCRRMEAVRCETRWLVGIHTTRLSTHTRRRAAFATGANPHRSSSPVRGCGARVRRSAGGRMRTVTRPGCNGALVHARAGVASSCAHGSISHSPASVRRPNACGGATGHGERVNASQGTASCQNRTRARPVAAFGAP